MADLPVYIMSGIGLVGVIAIIVWMGFLTQNKDNAEDIKKNLGIIAAVTFVIIGIFGAAAYVYFSANVAFLTPFVLIMTFVNLFLSSFAVSAASLQVINA
jgi:dipeptide/tripeptide permease